MTDWIGRTLSKVEIKKLLGHGGMAEVYLGRHTTLDRPVAVKILHSYLSQDAALLQRFRSEAQSVAALRHPHIVQVFDFDSADDHPYIIMELLEGPSLADYLQAQRRAGRRLPPEMAGRLVSGLASALDYAHARGIVHRDVKPANVVLRREAGAIDIEAPLPVDVEPILTDFGVARLSGAATQTASGLISGTPAYMSPEQARGDIVDARSDIYSLGVMLYEMLAGQPPFGTAEETAASLLIKHITAEPPPIPGLSAELAAVVMTVLAKDRDQRYQKAGDLAADLLAALNLAPATHVAMTRPAIPVVPAAAALAPAARPRAGNRSLIVGAVLTLVALGTVIFGRSLFTRPGAAPPAQDFGSLGIRDGSAQNDEATLAAINLPPLAAGTQYEAWLVGLNGETRHSLGVLAPDTDGKAQTIYIDEDGHNLLTEFDAMEITVEPSPDPNPSPSSTVAFSSVLPPQALVHVRHLITSFSKTPDQIGLAVGLVREAKKLDDSAQAMLAALQANDLAAVKFNAEGIVNLIEGAQGADFGDLDGDGAVTNPGDGFGLLRNGDNTGYIEGAHKHAELGAETPDATAHMKRHAGHVVIATDNVAGWAVQLRDLALTVATSTDTSKAEDNVRQAAELADRLLRGQDLNSNEIIEPVKGEGGALTVYQHAQYMADMFLFAGANQAPAAAPSPVPGATALPTDPGDFQY